LTDLEAMVVARSRGTLKHQRDDQVVAASDEVARPLVPARAGHPVRAIGVGLAGTIEARLDLP